MNQVWHSPYKLKRFGQMHSGALLKFNFPAEGVGYTDLFPWPSLGDPDLSALLEQLKSTDLESVDRETSLHPLLLRAIDFARSYTEPGAFSASGNIATHLQVEFSEDLLSRELESLIKLKLGRDVQREKELLPKIFAAHPKVLWRLDFNARLDRAQFRSFFTEVLAANKNRIEFIEDPYPFELSHWQEDQKNFQVSFALDRWDKQELPSDGYGVLVLKVDSQDCDHYLSGGQRSFDGALVTHSLGHTLGQAFALNEALSLNKRFDLRACGLRPTDEVWPGVFDVRGHRVGFISGAKAQIDKNLQEISWLNLIQ